MKSADAPAFTKLKLRDRLQSDSRTFLKQGDKQRLAAVRLIIADMRRLEIDSKTELDDTAVITLLEKMRKQRQDSIAQFTKADRQDLIEKEEYELSVIQSYLPEPIADSELQALIDEAIQTTGASSRADMGKVMGWIQPKVAGRADMRALSAQIMARLN